jgi:hypothetical protein
LSGWLKPWLYRHNRFADKKARLARPNFFAQQGGGRGDAKGLGVQVWAFQAFVLGAHAVDANPRASRLERAPAT